MKVAARRNFMKLGWAMALVLATKRCRSMNQCREALTAELGRLAREISMDGTTLNKLVTRTP